MYIQWMHIVKSNHLWGSGLLTTHLGTPICYRATGPKFKEPKVWSYIRTTPTLNRTDSRLCPCSELLKIVFCFVLFWKTVSHSPGWPGTSCRAEANLEILILHFHLPFAGIIYTTISGLYGIEGPCRHLLLAMKHISTELYPQLQLVKSTYSYRGLEFSF